MFHVKHSPKKGKVQNMNENKNKAQEEKKEVITLNKTKLNSFKAELGKVTKSMVKLSKLAFELATDKETKKLFIEEVSKMGMSRATAYSLINSGKAIHEREVLEQVDYTKTAEIGKIELIESNMEVFEGEIEVPIEEYANKKTQKEIREDVKNFNQFGTINPVKEEEQEEQEEETQEEEQEDTNDILKLSQAYNLISSIFESSTDETLINLVKSAMDYISEATSYIEVKERTQDNE